MTDVAAAPGFRLPGLADQRNQRSDMISSICLFSTESPRISLPSVRSRRLAALEFTGVKLGGAIHVEARDASFFTLSKRKGLPHLFRAQDRAIDDFTLKGISAQHTSYIA